MRDLGQDLKRARKSAGISQVDLARELGLTEHSQISKVERGHATTTLEKAQKWADLCGFEFVLLQRGSPDANALAAELVHCAPADRALLLELSRALPHLGGEARFLIEGVILAAKQRAAENAARPTEEQTRERVLREIGGAAVDEAGRELGLKRLKA